MQLRSDSFRSNKRTSREVRRQQICTAPPIAQLRTRRHPGPALSLTYLLTHSLTYSLTYLLADLVAAAILIPSRLSTGNRKFVGLFGHRPFLCERLGMHEEAKLLKRKLIDM